LTYLRIDEQLIMNPFKNKETTMVITMNAHMPKSFQMTAWTIALIIALIAVSALQRSDAATIDWTFNNAMWDDGGLLLGKFSYDTDLQTISAAGLGLATTLGTTGLFNTYTNIGQIHPLTPIEHAFASSGDFPPNNFSLLTLGDAEAPFTVSFATPGIINLATLSTKTELIVFGPARSLVSGTLIGVEVVPVPPAVWLFGSGLIGLIGVARRKKS